MKGFDCFASVSRRQANILKQLGYEFFARYYRRAPLEGGKGNAVSRAEMQGLFAEGFWALAIYQNTSDRPEYFTIQNAKADAIAALDAAKFHGQPTGTAIYFAVDTNPRAGDSKPGTFDLDDVIDYFEVIQTIVRQAGYRVGVYGSGLVCETLRRMKLVDHDWESNAEGWFGSKAYSNSHVKQTSLPFWVLPDLQIDANICLGPAEAGLWRPDQPAAPPARSLRALASMIAGWFTRKP